MTCPECRGEVVDPVKPGPLWPVMCRACFVRVDAVSEGLEHEAARWAFAPEELSGPGLRRVRPVADLTGRRFGRLVVTGKTIVEGSGRVRQAWRLRCECGDVLTMRPETIKRGASQCVRCADKGRGRNLLAMNRARAAA